MSLRSTLSLGTRASLEEGEPHEVRENKRRAYAEKVRPGRLEVARRNQFWTEIENDLVPRLGGRWLVSASTDRIYQRVHGTVFLPHSVNAIADRAEIRTSSMTTVTSYSSSSSPEPGRSASRRRRPRSFVRPLRSRGGCRREREGHPSLRAGLRIADTRRSQPRTRDHGSTRRLHDDEVGR